MRIPDVLESSFWLDDGSRGACGDVQVEGRKKSTNFKINFSGHVTGCWGWASSAGRGGAQEVCSLPPKFVPCLRNLGKTNFVPGMFREFSRDVPRNVQTFVVGKRSWALQETCPRTAAWACSKGPTLSAPNPHLGWPGVTTEAFRLTRGTCPGVTMRMTINGTSMGTQSSLMGRNQNHRHSELRHLGTSRPYPAGGLPPPMDVRGTCVKIHGMHGFR